MIEQMGIKRINWSPIPSDVVKTWYGGDSPVFALWPSPGLGHDLCFRNAGYKEDFEEDEDPNDESWDQDFVRCSEKLLSKLAENGSPRLRKASRWYLRSLFWKETPRLILLREILIALKNDATVCRIDFGEPARARLEIELGHPVWWISSPMGTEEWFTGIAREIANDLEIRRCNLQWDNCHP